MCGKSRQVVLGEKGQMCLRKDEKVYRLTLRQLLLPRSIVLTVVSLHLQESISYFFIRALTPFPPSSRLLLRLHCRKSFFLSVIFWEAVLCCSYGFGWLLFLMEREGGGGREEEDPKGSFPFSESGFDGRKEPFLATNGGLPPFCLGNRKETTSSSSTL